MDFSNELLQERVRSLERLVDLQSREILKNQAFLKEKFGSDWLNFTGRSSIQETAGPGPSQPGPSTPISAGIGINGVNSNGNKNALPQGRQGGDKGTVSVQMTDNLRSNDNVGPKRNNSIVESGKPCPLRYKGESYNKPRKRSGAAMCSRPFALRHW